MRFLALPPLVFSILLAGCDGSNKSAKTAPTLNERLETALAIADANARGVQLHRVALDAAEAGDSEVVKKAVAGIADANLKGQVASQCARKLRDVGQHQAAIEVAQMVPDSNARDALLANLARKP